MFSKSLCMKYWKEWMGSWCLMSRPHERTLLMPLFSVHDANSSYLNKKTEKNWWWWLSHRHSGNMSCMRMGGQCYVLNSQRHYMTCSRAWYYSISNYGANFNQRFQVKWLQSMCCKFNQCGQADDGNLACRHPEDPLCLYKKVTKLIEYLKEL